MQLLAAALQQEKPELETKRQELLRRQEDMKVSLLQLEETLLHKLASAQGNILSDTVCSIKQFPNYNEQYR